MAGLSVDLPSAPTRLFRGAKLRIEYPASFPFGVAIYEDATIGGWSYAYSRIVNVSKIGRYCSIAAFVEFSADEHPKHRLTTSPITFDPGFLGRNERMYAEPFDPVRAPIRVGNDVWIGLGACIKSGVCIGDGAIIGSRAVVTRDVEPYSIVVGSPGRVIKRRFPEKIIERLLALSWWDFDMSTLRLTDELQPEEMCDELERHISGTSFAKPPCAVVAGRPDGTVSTIRAALG